MDFETFKEQVLMTNSPLEAIELFYAYVCQLAEKKMLTTGKLEGAHFASMKEIAKKLELEVPGEL